MTSFAVLLLLYILGRRGSQRLTSIDGLSAVFLIVWQAVHAVLLEDVSESPVAVHEGDKWVKSNKKTGWAMNNERLIEEP